MALKNYIMLLFVALLAIPTTFAINQPNPFSTIPFEIATTGTIEGQECTNEYAVTGEYCSGAIKEFYQCLRYDMNTMIWQKRSEDCSKYSAVCIAKDCTFGYVGSKLGVAVLVSGLILIGVVSFAAWKVFKLKKKQVMWIAGILFLILILKIIQGGV